MTSTPHRNRPPSHQQRVLAGIHAFIERYRPQPYGSATDALADTQRSFRVVRAHAKEWGVDPKRVGIMGFSAGGEQAGWVTLKFDKGHPQASDPVERESCRPDFSVLVYAGWLRMDLSKVPKNAPTTFLTSAGIDDAFHARQTVEFYDALFKAKVPVELHIYGHHPLLRDFRILSQRHAIVPSVSNLLVA